MAPRKAHKKTRSGCVQCKKRKVKVIYHFLHITSPLHTVSLDVPDPMILYPETDLKI